MFPTRARRLLPTLLGLTLAAAAAPAAASAGSITVTNGNLHFTAAPGELNSVFYGRQYGDPDSSVQIGDTEVPTVLSGDCTESNGTLTCAGISSVTIDLGDRDDWGFAGAGDEFHLPVEIHGGPGNDQLKAAERGTASTRIFGDDGADEIKGGAGSDELHGGPGNDTIDGYGGADALYGEDGDDTLDGDTYAVAAPDVIDGGNGSDRADAWTGPQPSDHPPLAITMDGLANDGRPGEGDNVLSIERMVQHSSGSFTFTDAADDIAVYANLDMAASTINARGGNDLIAGGNADETIDAGAGDDRIDAGYGNDTITGGPGRDTISADKATSDCGVLQSCSLPQGNDTVYAVDGEADTISCGVGTDTVHADSIDTVAPDCETVDRSGKVTGPGAGGSGGPAGGGADLPRPRCSVSARRSGGRISVSGKVSLKGLKADALRGTQVTVEVRSGQRTLRTARVRIGKGGRFSARIKASGRNLKLRITVDATASTAPRIATVGVR